MAGAKAHGRASESRPLQCPNCSERMTLQIVKHEATKPFTTVFECKPCKLSITETIKIDPTTARRNKFVMGRQPSRVAAAYIRELRGQLDWLYRIHTQPSSDE